MMAAKKLSNLTFACIAILVSQCAQPVVAPQAEVGAARLVEPDVEQEIQTTAEPAPSLVAVQKSDVPLASGEVTLRGITIRYVTFSADDYRLRVVDQKGGPGSRFRSAREAAKSVDGVAAINAGFFTPEGEPLGFVVTGGDRRGARNRSSLGAGVYVDRGGRRQIVRRANYAGDAGVTEALQAGPFLIESGRVKAGLSDRKAAARSFVATDDKGGWAIAQTSSTNLKDLASVLAGQSLGEVKLQTALNLDGGRSCDLYISQSFGGLSGSFRGFFAADVRNWLVVTR